MTGEMSLTEALKIMEAPENVKLAFNKAYAIKGFPSRGMESQVLTQNVDEILRW